LDEEKGGHFSILPDAEQYTVEQQYITNTNMLRTVFTSSAGSFEVVDFAPRFRQYERLYKPTKLMRRVRPLQGSPRVKVQVRPVYDYGRLVPAWHASSNHIQWAIPGASLRLTSNVPLSYIAES